MIGRIVCWSEGMLPPITGSHSFHCQKGQITNNFYYWYRVVQQNWWLNLWCETKLHLGDESSGGISLSEDYIMLSPMAEGHSQPFCLLFRLSRQTLHSGLVHDTYLQSPIAGIWLHHTLLQRGEMQGREAGENTASLVQSCFPGDFLKVQMNNWG